MQSAADIANQHPEVKREEFMKLFDQYRGKTARVAQVPHGLQYSYSVAVVLYTRVNIYSFAGSERKAVTDACHRNYC